MPSKIDHPDLINAIQQLYDDMARHNTLLFTRLLDTVEGKKPKVESPQLELPLEFKDERPIEEDQPDPEPAATLDHVREALTEFQQAHGKMAVKELLLAHGAGKLSALDPSKYRDVITSARGA